MKISLWCSATLNLLSLGATAAQAQPIDITSTVNLEANADFEVREETYTLPDAVLESAGDIPPEAADWVSLHPEMVGLVVSPVNAPGPRPIAFFIHGVKSTCYDPIGATVADGWPCADGLEPVPSYRGFLPYQRFLAARGWVTVSIGTNGINASVLAMLEQGDAALRGELVEKHLQQWAAWLAGDTTQPPPAFITAGVRPDLQRLLLIGHSRGGGAAHQVASNNLRDPSSAWRVRAQVLIGPVAAYFNPPPSLPTVVLLPECDGDVLDLQGQSYVDRSRDYTDSAALRSAVFIPGANHNFFNAQWDPTTATVPGAVEDDVNKLFAARPLEGACRPDAPERLSGEAQRELGTYLVAAAGKAFVEGDASVLPLFDGSPVCAGPTCRAHVATHALGGRRQPLLIPTTNTSLLASEQVSLTHCITDRKLDEEAACITQDMPTFATLARTPHFLPADNFGQNVIGAGARVALPMQWTTAAGAARVELSHHALSREATDLAMRVIVDPAAVETEFALSLIDSAGTVLPLGAATLSSVSQDASPTSVYWAQEVRLSIDVAAASAAGFDVNAIQSVEIIPRSSSGRLWLLDMWSYAPGA